MPDSPPLAQPSTEELLRRQVTQTRRMMLVMAALAAAFGAASVAPYIDDREVVQARQTAHGIEAFSYTTTAPQGNLAIVAESETLRAAPGLDAETTRAMNDDPDTKIMALYEADPTNPAPLLNAAIIYARVGELRKAERYLAMAEENHPEDVLIPDFRTQFDEAKRTGDFSAFAPMGPDGSPLDTEGAEALPDQHPVVVQDAPALTPEEEQTFNQLKATLDADPNNFELAAQTGAMYVQSGKYQLAQEFLKHAMRLNPDEEGVLHMLCVAYAMGGEPELARSLMLGLSQREPRNGMAYYQLGILEERFFGDIEKALEYYRKCQDPSIELDQESREEAKQFEAELMLAAQARGMEVGG